VVLRAVPGWQLMSVQSFGRLGAPTLTLLGDLAGQVVQVGGPGFFQTSFILGGLQEHSVAFRGHASLCRSCAYLATWAAGRIPMRRLAWPFAELVKAYLSLMCGFWVSLCFSLRGLALCRVWAVAPTFDFEWRCVSSEGRLAGGLDTSPGSYLYSVTMHCIAFHSAALVAGRSKCRVQSDQGQSERR
jgi:hypothetical protein